LLEVLLQTRGARDVALELHRIRGGRGEAALPPVGVLLAEGARQAAAERRQRVAEAVVERTPRDRHEPIESPLGPRDQVDDLDGEKLGREPPLGPYGGGVVVARPRQPVPRGAQLRDRLTDQALDLLPGLLPVSP